jgi:hypothetical protein
VVIANYGGLDRLVEALKPVEYTRMEMEHALRRERWRQQFIEHVDRRHIN